MSSQVEKEVLDDVKVREKAFSFRVRLGILFNVDVWGSKVRARKSNRGIAFVHCSTAGKNGLNSKRYS